MPRKTQSKKQPNSTLNNVTPPVTVPFESGFHFYTSFGNYTGITATSLSEFAAKLKIVPIESVTFHFKRKDFRNWLKNTMKDSVLAEKVGAITVEQPAEKLRDDILKALETSKLQVS
jgi:hypothetical protein